jgi:transposase-like protein
MFFKIICAWCSKYMGIKGIGLSRKSSFSISHGICPDCTRKLLEQLKDDNST